MAWFGLEGTFTHHCSPCPDTCTVPGCSQLCPWPWTPAGMGQPWLLWAASPWPQLLSDSMATRSGQSRKFWAALQTYKCCSPVRLAGSFPGDVQALGQKTSTRRSSFWRGQACPAVHTGSSSAARSEGTGLSFHHSAELKTPHLKPYSRRQIPSQIIYQIEHFLESKLTLSMSHCHHVCSSHFPSGIAVLS